VTRTGSVETLERESTDHTSIDWNSHEFSSRMNQIDSCSLKSLKYYGAHVLIQVSTFKILPFHGRHGDPSEMDKMFPSEGPPRRAFESQQGSSLPDPTGPLMGGNNDLLQK